MCIALVCLGTWQTIIGFYVSALIYGVATGLISPAISAWTIDLSDKDKRGLSIATMYIGLEAGIGLGALLAGWFFQDFIQRVPYILYGVAFANGLGLLYLFFHKDHTTLKSSS